MKNKILAFFTGLFLAAAFTGCGENNPEKSRISQEIYSVDYKYVLDAPVDWTINENRVNNDTSLEIMCPRGMAFAALVDAAGTDVLDYSNYCNLAVKNINNMYYTNFKYQDFEDKDIGGRQVKFLDAKDISLEGEKCRVWLYVAEINGNFAQFIIALPESIVTDDKKEEVEMMINSFRKYNN